MHIPPRAVFFSQILGSFIGVPINYGVIRWVIDKKGDYLNHTLDDPTHEWNGQALRSSLTMAVQYVLVVSSPLILDCLFTNPSGPSTPLIRYSLPTSPLRIPSRSPNPRPPLPPPPPLPPCKIPPLEHHHILLRVVKFLWQHQHGLHICNHRRIRSHVLGVSI